MTQHNNTHACYTMFRCFGLVSHWNLFTALLHNSSLPYPMISVTVGIWSSWKLIVIEIGISDRNCIPRVPRVLARVLIAHELDTMRQWDGFKPAQRHKWWTIRSYPIVANSCFGLNKSIVHFWPLSLDSLQTTARTKWFVSLQINYYPQVLTTQAHTTISLYDHDPHCHQSSLSWLVIMY